jgi:hypothetical protein
MKKRYASATFAITAVAIFLAALVITRVMPAGSQTRIEQFFDNEYEYSFKYPAGWAIQKFPEGQANKEVRVTLRGPNGSSFTVIVEKVDKRITKEEFEANPKRKELVQTMMAETVEQIYKVISRNIQASGMTVGERRDLSTEAAVKFYVATRHATPDGKSIVVAGIHAYPFAKDYGISFLMTAFLDNISNPDIDALMLVFNSFHLSGEPNIAEDRPGPAAKVPEKRGPQP